MNFGLLSIIPPLLTIILALAFKDVILALTAGIFSGALLITHGSFFHSIGFFADRIAESLSDQWNIRIFLFCAILGGLVSLLNKTGSVRAFGEWAAGKLKSRRGAMFFTFGFGMLIFIDDYFNSLAVGTAMRPVCDRLKIARAKLAYLLDSTAAPVCIIAPVSSWVVIVMSYSREAQGFSSLGVSELDLFIRLIPYNFYVFLTFLMIALLILLNRDFGPMRRAEDRAKSGQGLFDSQTYGEASVPEELTKATKAKPFDMLVPFLVLIISTVISFPVTTWKMTADKTAVSFAQAVESVGLRQAFCDTDASRALMYSIIFTIVFVNVWFLLRRLMSFRDISDCMIAGVRSMVPVLIILVLAWTIGAIIKRSPPEGGIGLANYLADFTRSSQFPFFLIPISVFFISCLTSFSTGTSWGTMAIMISIVLPIAVEAGKGSGLSGDLLLNAVCFTLSATIGGAIYGDHTSPISDTTILSATGAGCPCMEHVTTQMPYATLVAGCAALGYLIGGYFGMSLYTGAAAAFISFVILLSALLFFRKGSDPRIKKTG